MDLFARLGYGQTGSLRRWQSRNQRLGGFLRPPSPVAFEPSIELDFVDDI
jgi:hypothetical protein